MAAIAASAATIGGSAGPRLAAPPEFLFDFPELPAGPAVPAPTRRARIDRHGAAAGRARHSGPTCGGQTRRRLDDSESGGPCFKGRRAICSGIDRARGTDSKPLKSPSPTVRRAPPHPMAGVSMRTAQWRLCTTLLPCPAESRARASPPGPTAAARRRRAASCRLRRPGARVAPPGRF